MIKIKSKQAGFRRCGIAHAAETVEYLDWRFSESELAILKAEPMLTVEIVAPPAKPGKVDENDHESATAAESIPEPVKAAETGKEPVKPGKKGKR